MAREEVQVRRVDGAREFKTFLTFPRRIYRSDPLWVPPLLREEKKLLSPGADPFWRHAARELFLAWRNGRPAGRIAAVRDENFVRHHQSPTGSFGFFECEDDPGAARALLGAAEGWLKNQGAREMIGPLNPSTNHVCGLLLKGYHSPPKFLMPYNPRYYHRLLADAGLEKARDLLAYRLPVPDRVDERLERLAAALKKRGLKVRKLDLKNLRGELKLVQKIYNSAWSDNWGFTPLTDAEIEHMASALKPLVVADLALFAEFQGRAVGFFLALPDYNQVLIKLGGRLGPIQIAKFVLLKRKITDLRLMMAGIEKEAQKKGLDGLLYHESALAARRLGYRCSEISWLLEDNLLVIRAAEMMGARLDKTYRIYRKNPV